jgi:hypothetical protein
MAARPAGQVSCLASAQRQLRESAPAHRLDWRAGGDRSFVAGTRARVRTDIGPRRTLRTRRTNTQGAEGCRAVFQPVESVQRDHTPSVQSINDGVVITTKTRPCAARLARCGWVRGGSTGGTGRSWEDSCGNCCFRQCMYSQYFVKPAGGELNWRTERSERAARPRAVDRGLRIADCGLRIVLDAAQANLYR